MNRTQLMSLEKQFRDTLSQGYISNNLNSQNILVFIITLLTASQKNNSDVVIRIPNFNLADDGTLVDDGTSFKMSFHHSSGGYLSIGRYGVVSPVSNVQSLSDKMKPLSDEADVFNKFCNDVGAIECLMLAFISNMSDTEGFLEALFNYGFNYRYNALLVTAMLDLDSYMNGELKVAFNYSTDADLNLTFKSDLNKTII